MKNYILGGCLLILSTSLAHSDETMAMAYGTTDGEHQRQIVWDAYFTTFGGYNWTEFDSSGFNDNFDDFSYGARASGAYNFDNGISLQKDFVYRRDDTGLDISSPPFVGDITSSDVDAAVHVFHQNSKYLLGVIGQVGRTTFDFASFSQETNRFYVGGEAQHYFGKFTLYGQVAYEKTQTDNFGLYGAGDVSSDGVIASLQGRYFLTDDWRFDVKGTYAFQKYDIEGLELDAWTFNAGTEYKIEDTPFSLTSDLTWSVADNYGVSSQNTTFLLGVKMNLGAETLMERDRGGATLDPVETDKPFEDVFLTSPVT